MKSENKEYIFFTLKIFIATMFSIWMIAIGFYYFAFLSLMVVIYNSYAIIYEAKATEKNNSLFNTEIVFSSKKVISKFVCFLFIPVFILITFTFVCRLNYDKTIKHVANGDYSIAQENLFFPEKLKLVDKDLYEFLDTVSSFNIDSSASCEKTIQRLTKLDGNSYKYAEPALETIEQQIYEEGLSLFEAKKYSDAFKYIKLLDNYKDSSSYAIVCSAMGQNCAPESTLEKLCKLLPFEPAKDALLQNTPFACGFLEGHWHSTNNNEKYHYLSFSDDNDSYYARYNLPYSTLDDSYFEFDDGIYRLENASDSIDVFKFTINDLNNIDVYCFEDNQKYSLTRDDEKYRNSFNYRDTPDSTAFSKVGYRASTQTLYVEFRNTGEYYYYDFSQQDYDVFLSAESLGRYHAYNIKNHYRYEKIEYDERDYEYDIDYGDIPDECIEDFYDSLWDYNPNADYSDAIKEYFYDWIIDHYEPQYDY